MAAFLKALRGSLSARLLVPLFVTTGLALGVYAALSLHATRRGFRELVRAEAERTTSLVLSATHDGMLLNRKDLVQGTVERLVRNPKVTAIRIYDMAGRVALSAAQDEVGRRVAISDPPCVACHAADGSRPPVAMLEGGAGVRPAAVRHLTVIPNEASCASAHCHAHPAAERVLGVLDLELSSQPLETALAAAQSTAVWGVALVLVVAGLVSTGLVNRVVHEPIKRLEEGTRRLAAGDLTARIEVPGRHELAELAEAFNRMAEELAAAQHQLTDWSRRLEEKVVEKTGELQKAQRQVLHMEKMASLGKLSATVAHELNNPLSGILTYARLVERELTDLPLEEAPRAEMGDHLRLIQAECRRCGGIVQNLLLFARRTEGAAMAPVDLDAVVERGLKLVRHHLDLHAIHLDLRPLGGDLRPVADAGQLEQALVALFVNAIEAMEGPEGGDELAVHLTREDGWVRIDVGDTGVGIHPDILPHIFEPFFSTKNQESGVGLGLAVVYGIVERHGGSIEVESQPGRGTVFHLRLPADPGDAGRGASRDGARRQDDDDD
jgi:two-component system NtrC family sensor kinase